VVVKSPTKTDHTTYGIQDTTKKPEKLSKTPEPQITKSIPQPKKDGKELIKLNEKPAEKEKVVEKEKEKKPESETKERVF